MTIRRSLPSTLREARIARKQAPWSRILGFRPGAVAPLAAWPDADGLQDGSLASASGTSSAKSTFSKAIDSVLLS
jgi:hypothetical protein